MIQIIVSISVGEYKKEDWTPKEKIEGDFQLAVFFYGKFISKANRTKRSGIIFLISHSLHFARLLKKQHYVEGRNPAWSNYKFEKFFFLIK